MTTVKPSGCKDAKSFGPDFKTYASRIAERKEKFPVPPGIKAWAVWALCTTIYILSFVYIEKHKFEDENTSDQDKGVSVASGILGYFIFVLPLCMIVYIWGIYGFFKSDYHLYNPTAKWPGGLFWGGMCLFILTGIVVCIVVIQYYQGNSLSVFWILPLALMAVVISVGAGTLGNLVINCKLMASEEYKHLYECVEIESRKLAELQREETRSNIEKATLNLEESRRTQKDLSGSVEEAAKVASRSILPASTTTTNNNTRNYGGYPGYGGYTGYGGYSGYGI